MFGRRQFLAGAGLGSLAVAANPLRGLAADAVLPFGNGERPLVAYSRGLLVITDREGLEAAYLAATA